MSEFRIPERARRALEQQQEGLFDNGEPLPVPGEAVSGKYHGSDPTATERASGTQIELENQGPLKPNGAGHRVLAVYACGERMTAYDASFTASDDHHALRRESARLLERGFLMKDGTMRNPAQRGRDHVDAYRITAAGKDEIARLEGRSVIPARQAERRAAKQPGFVCFDCKCPVDFDVRGPHAPGCSQAWRNEGLQPWSPDEQPD